MYCPKCSQLQVSDEIQFCSRCGLPLSELKEIITEGKPKAKQPKMDEDKLSPREKGVRQGVMLMFLSIILVPAYILLAALFPANDQLVESAVSDTPFEKISQAILFSIFMLGLGRLVYAWLFQRGTVIKDDAGESAQLKSSAANYALPAEQSVPASAFGSWRANSGELAQAPNVAAHTTGSLNSE